MQTPETADWPADPGADAGNGRAVAQPRGTAPKGRAADWTEERATSEGGGSQRPGGGRPQSGRLAAVARRHWLMAALLLAGLALRALAQIAYRPALLYIDTVKYLYNAWPGGDPVGYKVPLAALLQFGNLQTVTAVQHLLGLAMAVMIYALLLRRGVARWLAALATAPVLLDAYQLQMEQTIMPDVWLEALIVGGLALLLWRSRPTLWAIAAAGLVLGASATVRQIGEILVLPAAVYVLIAVGKPGERSRAVGAAFLLVVAFAVPILTYMSISDAKTGHFWLASGGSGSTYGRMAEAADCATLKLPTYMRPLCPTPAQKKMGPDNLDHALNSPLRLYKVPRGRSKHRIVSYFTRAVVTQQPLRVLGAVTGDAVKLFALTRDTSPGDTPISRWQFQDRYPPMGQAVSVARNGTIVVGLKNPGSRSFTYRPLDPSMGGKARVDRPVAAFLRAYQLHGGYTPGPLYLLATVAGLIGTLSLARRRLPPAARELVLGCGLFFVTAAAILLASDVFEFSWRYQLPALVTLPPAGALGIAVIVGFVGQRRTGHAGRTAADGTATAADGTATGAAWAPSEPAAAAGDQVQQRDRDHLGAEPDADEDRQAAQVGHHPGEVLAEEPGEE